MRKILLTGSTGFIGRHLVNNLQNKNILYLTLRGIKNKKVLNKKKNIRFITFNNHKTLNRKLKKIRVDFVVHCATNYVKHHKSIDISKIIYSNVEFGTIILDNLNVMNVKKFINFSTVWQNYGGKLNKPFNLYAASKNAFNKVLNYYQRVLNKVYFYNIFISDTFGNNDKRRKLINVIKSNIYKNKSIKIESSNLYINLLNVIDIVFAINLLINKKIKSGDYNIVNNKFFKISKIISILKKNKNVKLKMVYKSKKYIKDKIFKNKNLPRWNHKNSELDSVVNYLLT